MNKINIKIGVLWVYISSIVNVGSSLILLPFVLHFLTTKEVGIWFVFITIVGASQLIEIGFQSTLTRNIAYIYEGMQFLSKIGMPEIKGKKQINYRLLGELISSAKLIYLMFAGIGALLLFMVGYFYVPKLLEYSIDFQKYQFIWFLFAIGGILNIHNGMIIGILYGKGDFIIVSKINVVSKIILIITGICGLYFNYGLISIGVSNIIGSLVSKFLLSKILGKKILFSKINFSNLEKEINLLKILSVNAFKISIVQIGGFLIQRANIIIVTSFMGPSDSSSYSLTISLLLTLSGISMAICQIQLPKISRLQIYSNKKSLAIKYGELIFISTFIYITGCIFIYFFGNYLLAIIGSKVNLLDNLYLIILMAIFLLEMNHSLAGSYLTTLNKIPFLSASLISGLIISILTLLLIPKFGILAVLLIQGIVQLSFNNWKWPFEVEKLLNYNQYELFKIGANSTFSKLLFVKL